MAEIAMSFAIAVKCDREIWWNDQFCL